MIGDVGGFMDALNAIGLFLAMLMTEELFYASAITNLFKVIYKNTEKTI